MKTGQKVTREEILAEVAAEGSQSAAAAKLGITKQRVSQVVNNVPKPSRSLKKREEFKPKASYYNGPLRPNQTRLQIPGVYSKGQQRFTKAIEGLAIAPLAASFGYRGPSQIYWLRDGSVPHPSLVIAVQIEKRFGVKCVDWFEPPVLDNEKARTEKTS